jgi:hypothetical protein
LIAAQFNLVGPVVAIARPGERLPEIGPYRIQLPAGEDWHAEVRAYLERSAAIVLVFGTTEGLLWELREIVGRVAAHLLRVPTDRFDRARLPLAAYRGQIRLVAQLEALRAINPHDLLMAAIGAGGKLTAFCSASHIKASYEMAFAATWLLCHHQSWPFVGHTNKTEPRDVYGPTREPWRHWVRSARWKR